MIEKLNYLMIDRTFLYADLCPPVKGRVIHHPVVHHVGLSVEPAKTRHSSSPTTSIIINIFSKSEKEATVSSLWSELTLRCIFSCIKPECRRRLRLRAAPVRWQYQHTWHLNLEKYLWWTLATLTRFHRDSINKYRWHSLIATSRKVRFFITLLCVLRFGCRGGEKGFLLHMAAVACPSWITPVIRYQETVQS